jgi:hypothetical protein
MKSPNTTYLGLSAGLLVAGLTFSATPASAAPHGGFRGPAHVRVYGGGYRGSFHSYHYPVRTYHATVYHGHAYYPYHYRGYSVAVGVGYAPSYYYPSYPVYPATVVEPPVVVQPPPVVAAPAPTPGFVQTRARYHGHGDNAGQIDWVEGYLDGRPIRYYYDDHGRLKKQKWLDLDD